MNIEFKEKTFEKYFSNQLARLTNITYSPDQCDESLLGFDDAFYLSLVHLRGLAPFRRLRRWERLKGMSITEFDNLGRTLGHRLPPFRFNLFVQYKRPVRLVSRNAGEWSHWKQSYYRYSITSHQQDILSEIEEQSFGRATTIYASPAFWQVTELWDIVRAQRIVESSNLASVGRLKSHAHYSYVTAGFIGKGHSEATDIESLSFETIFARGLEQEALPFDIHIVRTAKQILEVVRSQDSGLEIFERVRIVFGVEPIDRVTFSVALDIIEIFSDAFEVSYQAFG